MFSTPKASPLEFRRDAAARRGDAPPPQIAKDSGIPESCPRRRLKLTDSDDGVRPGMISGESAEQAGRTGFWSRKTGSCAATALFAVLQKNVPDRQRWTSRKQLRLAIITWTERTYHHRRQRRLSKLTPSKTRCSTPRPRKRRLQRVGDRPGEITAGARAEHIQLGACRKHQDRACHQQHPHHGQHTSPR